VINDNRVKEVNKLAFIQSSQKNKLNCYLRKTALKGKKNFVLKHEIIIVPRKLNNLPNNIKYKKNPHLFNRWGLIIVN